MQDTESAAEEHGLYLSYGAVDPGEGLALRIANEIIDALARHGLKTEWDGSWQTRVHVSLVWKRRFPEDSD